MGGLPEDLQFELIEPLRELFKARERGRRRGLGLDDRQAGELCGQRIWRHTGWCTGPASSAAWLAVACVGAALAGSAQPQASGSQCVLRTACFLSYLTQDEVRALGRLLGVPEQFIERHPFPGPGLAVRIIGDVTGGQAAAPPSLLLPRCRLRLCLSRSVAATALLGSLAKGCVVTLCSGLLEQRWPCRPSAPVRPSARHARRFLCHRWPCTDCTALVSHGPAEGDRLDVLREVDEVFINAIREWGLYDKIWQAFAVFLPVRSVGEAPACGCSSCCASGSQDGLGSQRAAPRCSVLLRPVWDGSLLCCASPSSASSASSHPALQAYRATSAHTPTWWPCGQSPAATGAQRRTCAPLLLAAQRAVPSPPPQPACCWPAAGLVASSCLCTAACTAAA